MDELLQHEPQSMEGIQNQYVMPFQNPICKETYDSLPRIYGNRNHKPKKIDKPEHKLKNINMLQFNHNPQLSKEKRSLSRYLFSGKVQYRDIIHRTRRYLTEHYSPSVHDGKSEEKSTSNSIKKTYNVEQMLPQAKNFKLDDLESSHKVLTSLNPDQDQSRAQTQLQKFIALNSRARINTEPQTSQLAKNRISLPKLAKKHRELKSNGIRKQINAATAKKSARYSSQVEGLRNSYEQIKEESEDDRPQDTKTKMMKKKRKKYRLEVSTDYEKISQPDKARLKLSSSVLNGIDSDPTMFRNIEKNLSTSRSKSKIGSILSSGYFKVPQPGQYKNFISNYKPHNPQFSIKELFKKEEFKIVKEDKSVYFGEVNESREKHGMGVLITEKQLFQGYFENDEKMLGYEKNMDGIYIGGFKNGLRSGKGQFKWHNGETFVGNWESGMKSGFGKWKSPEGHFYEGNWEKNMQNGKGNYKHRLSFYKGEFKDFLKHGEGEQKFANGDLYEGQYQNGKPHGEGKYTWHKGGIYIGSFVQGLREGVGKWTDEKGNIYSGQFKEDEKHGSGEEIYISGQKFKGCFELGHRKSGTLLRVNGEEIEVGE